MATGYSRKGGLKTQYTMRQISDTCVRITGRSYLGAVNNTSTGGNAIGLLFDVNPSLLGDRVAVVASTYDKYCYQSMKFSYVPQCPTSQPGSVMLVFERDPEAPAADSQATASYMQEVMSYEHAVLTPAWVATSVTYKRDPHEVKTWFMGGDQANLSARETSQGTFIAYTSNATVQSSPGANGKLGFVVMDYVLDLVSPNILPNKIKQFGGQQYQQVSNFALQNVSGNPLPAGTFQQQFFPGSASGANSITQIPNIAFATLAGTGAGTILEVVLDGGAGTNANNGQSITAYLAAFDASSATPNNPVLSSGSRFYLTQVQSFNATTSQPGNAAVWYAAATLADAIAVAAINGSNVTTGVANQFTTYQVIPAALACSATTWGASNLLVQQNAFVRIISAPKLSASTA